MSQKWKVAKPVATNFIYQCCLSVWSSIYCFQFNFNQQTVSDSNIADIKGLKELFFYFTESIFANLTPEYRPFPGGIDIDGNRLFICRTFKFGQIIPGKYSKAIGKCSISRNYREYQFNQFEILITSAEQQYEWVKVKKPAKELPFNALYGGSQHGLNKPKPTDNSNNNILSSIFAFRLRKRRPRRSIAESWSVNWRGTMAKPASRFINHFVNHFRILANSNFTEVPVMPNSTECALQRRKLNYFIAKCRLQTGNVISEQIGKIWWHTTSQEWVASFPFGGHEIYCHDYSILAIKVLSWKKILIKV